MVTGKRIALFLLLMSFFYPLRLTLSFFGYQRITYIVIAVLITAIFRFKCREEKLRVAFIWSLVPLIFVYFYVYIFAMFGDFDFGAIVYHMEYGVQGGRPPLPVSKMSYITLSFFAFLGSLFYLRRRDRRFHYVDVGLAPALILANPILWTAIDYYFSPSDPTLTNFYAAPPKQLPEGVNKKNIIIIYAESEERTFADINRGSDTFEEMSEIAAAGLDVRGIRQVTNTGWTMAGFISSQCGVPLQPRGVFSENSFTTQTSFFGSIRCLSDVLGASGYHTEFMNGSESTFAGLKIFLDGHGFSFRSGLEDYRDIAGDYINTWGLYDDTMFEQAQKRVEILQRQARPFAFSIATIGAHSPSGHVTSTCRQNLEQGELSEMQFAVKCAGYQIKTFLADLKRKGLLENTIVAIQSDHLVMLNEHSSELNRMHRMNYFSISGEGIVPSVMKREAAMFDVFPTLLEALGMKLPGGRAGIGVSLFNGGPNLVETYGEDKLNGMLRRDWLLSRKLWGDVSPEI